MALNFLKQRCIIFKVVLISLTAFLFTIFLLTYMHQQDYQALIAIVAEEGEKTGANHRFLDDLLVELNKKKKVADYAAGLVIALTGSLLIWLPLRTILNPLAILTEKAKLIGNGDFTQPIQVHTCDQIGTLAQAMEFMRQSIQERDEKLQQGKSLFKTLSDFANDWIFWRNPAGEMLYISPACEKISGYTVREFLQNPDLCNKIVHPEDQAAWQEHVQLADRQGSPAPMEFRIITKSGEIKWISHICQPIYDQQGAFMGTRGSNTDITQRKLMTIALEKEQQFIKAMLESLAVGVMACDEKGILTLFNQATKEFTGKPLEPLPVEKWAAHYNLYYPDSQSLMKKEDIPLYQALTKGSIHNVELLIKSESGKQRLFLVSGQAILDSQGQKLGAVAVMHDITELKETEAALRQQLQFEAVANQKLKALSARVIQAQEAERKRLSRELHDELGQILTALKLDLQMLSEEISQSDPKLQNRLAESISLVNNVMNLVRRQAVSLRPPVLDDVGLIEAVKNMSQGFSNRTKIATAVIVNEPVKQIPYETKVALYRCIQESLTNVARHAQASRVEISFTWTDDLLTVRIADNGRGFDVHKKRDLHQHIGLIGMEERVHLIGGEISISSQAGVGTEIIIKAPIGLKGVSST